MYFMINGTQIMVNIQTNMAFQPNVVITKDMLCAMIMINYGMALMRGEL